MSASLPISLRSADRKILVVDPQEIVRTLVCRMVQMWGLSSCSASNLIEACQAVVSEGPLDAVICDYELPDGNAYNLIAWMRQHHLNVPTIVPFGALRPLAEPDAGVELLFRPFDAEELKATLERILGIGAPEARPVEKE